MDRHVALLWRAWFAASGLVLAGLVAWSLWPTHPGPADVAASRSRGADPGGLVMIHGMKNGLGWLGRLHLAIDWTDGCVAVTDREMDEIWRVVPDGAKIVLEP